jgi:glycosyltransferase involved in cell wall biosynthesis
MAKIGFLSEMYFFFDGKSFQSGGGEKYQFSLIQLLIEQGHDVSVYQFSWEPFTTKYKNSQGSFTVRGLGNVSKEPGADYATSLRNGVDMFIEKTKDCDMYILLTVNLAYKTMPKPTVSIFHGVYWNFESENYKQPEWNEMCLKRWVRNVETIVSVDTDCINLVRACYPRYVGRMRYIPNFCNIDLFKPNKRPEDGLFKVLYARRINGLRGIGLFLKSAEELTKKYPDIYFTICGKGLGDAELQVENWCKQNRNCEHTSHDLSEMHLEYNKHDINVVPSIASEGLSLSMLEGMACGLPCIGTDVGGIPNALINNYNGIMITANNQSELTNAIEFAYLNREKVKEWGINAHSVAQTFNEERWKSQWVNIINFTLRERETVN